MNILCDVTLNLQVLGTCLGYIYNDSSCSTVYASGHTYMRAHTRAHAHTHTHAHTTHHIHTTVPDLCISSDMWLLLRPETHDWYLKGKWSEGVAWVYEGTHTSWRGRLSLTNLSLESKLPMFRLNVLIAIWWWPYDWSILHKVDSNFATI